MTQKQFLIEQKRKYKAILKSSARPDRIQMIINILDREIQQQANNKRIKLMTHNTRK